MQMVTKKLGARLLTALLKHDLADMLLAKPLQAVQAAPRIHVRNRFYVEDQGVHVGGHWFTR